MVSNHGSKGSQLHGSYFSEIFLVRESSLSVNELAYIHHEGSRGHHIVYISLLRRSGIHRMACLVRLFCYRFRRRLYPDGTYWPTSCEFIRPSRDALGLHYSRVDNCNLRGSTIQNRGRKFGVSRCTSCMGSYAHAGLTMDTRHAGWPIQPNPPADQSTIRVQLRMKHLSLNCTFKRSF